METKNNLPYGIKQPTTVQEFRDNLKKYYVTVGNELYTQSNGFIPLNKISCFDDIYRITNSSLNGESPSISPKIYLKKDLGIWYIENGCTFDFSEYFKDEKCFEVIENQEEFMERGNPKWWYLDDKIMRYFYILTLGDYCGYSMMEV